LKKVYFTSLGCKVNQYEMQLLREQFEIAGFAIEQRPQTADICIVNTCSVTSNSDKKSRKAIERIIRLNPQACLVVCGCCVDNEYSTVNLIEGPQYFIKNKDKLKIPQFFNIGPSGIEGITRFSERDRAFVKIQDGCDNYCSYCIVAYTRGKPQSRSEASILNEIEGLAANGYKEIVLTGINIGYYGRDTNTDLFDLLNKATKIEGLGRIRLSSINPEDINEPLIETIKDNDKICNHLHISVQSASEKILNLMNRKYSEAYLLNTLDKIRIMIPHIGLSGDFICGFPQEGDKDFKKTLNLIKKYEFIKTHIFTYSDREKTVASSFEAKVEESIKKQRSQALKIISCQAADNFIKRFIGKELSVLVEFSPDRQSGYYCGYTQNYIKTLIKDASREFRGSIVSVEVQKSEGNRAVSFLKSS
jgi:threonylcarbamoyladenosine tRNA methylthiotransferase MtaB